MKPVGPSSISNLKRRTGSNCFKMFTKFVDCRLGFFGVALRVCRYTAMNASTKLAVVSAFLASALSAHAAIINLDLLGKAGPGLLAGNETGTIIGSPGSGGEFGTGITFDNVSLQLSITVAWGITNGFTNLTGNATVGHIHGPTTSGGTASFTQTANPAFTLDTLPTWNSSASGGSVSGTFTLTSTQATDLLAGKFYVNIHTGSNPNGEIRGNIVPEPSSFGLLSLGMLGMLRRRR
jgi:CHRD domain/PEP-CTERM motif